MKLLIIILVGIFSISTSAQQWRSFGLQFYNPGQNTQVESFHLYNDFLYIGGGFTTAGGVTVKSIAKFDSTNFFALGSGLTYTGGGVTAIHDFNNNVIIGGSFTIVVQDSVNTTSIKNLASWDSSSWNMLGNLNPSNQIRTLANFNNTLYIGGNFAQIGTALFNRIAKWDGSSWSGVGGGISGSLPDVYAMSVYNNELYVGGDIAAAGTLSVSNIARWDGAQWHAVGNGLNNAVICLLTDTVENVLYAAGNFSNPSDTGFSINIARWNGINWSFIGNGFDSRINTLCMYKGCLYAGGIFTKSADGLQTFNGIARWDGISWHPLGSGTDHNVYALQVYKDELYVGGGYTMAGGLAAYGLAKWYVPNDSCLINVPSQSDVKLELKIYPNPNSGNVTVELSFPIKQKTILQIYNSKGVLFRKFIVSENENKKEIDTSKWSKGIYYCALVQNEKKITVKKLIVE